MFVDEQTFQDLEAITPSSGGRGLADLLDRTRTRAGALLFRERLNRPASDPTLLAMGFEATRFLAERVPDVAFDADAVQAVTTYLGSRVQTLGERSLRPGVLEAAWIALSDAELLAVARSGVPAVRRLVESLSDLSTRIVAAAPPAGVGVILESIVGLLQKLDLPRLWAGRERAWTTLQADHEIRSRHHGDMTRLLALVARLDVEFALSRLVNEGFALPSIDTSTPFLIEIEGVHHPLLSAPIANPIQILHTEGVVLVTGPNMAGKTTYLRGVGACVHLAHCGIPVPANSMRFRPLDALFVSLNPRDAPAQGVSFFMGEVLRVRAVLERVAAGQRVLAIFDELFRGTNQGEALAASSRVLRAAAECPALGMVVSSHLTELAEELTDLRGVALHCFEGRIEGEALVFDFRLRPGVSTQRLGLELLRRSGVDALLKTVRGAGAAGAV